MTDLGKNGYKWTGYTEPFFTSIVLTTPTLLNSFDYDGMGAGIVAIENTEYRNAGLYVRALTGGVDITEFTSANMNFDDKKDALNTSLWVLEIGTDNFVTVDLIESDVDTSETIPKIIYTITVSGVSTVVAGQAYRVVGRQVDVGTVSTSRTYAIDEKVLEVYPFQT